jgi:hypothetical protein
MLKMSQIEQVIDASSKLNSEQLQDLLGYIKHLEEIDRVAQVSPKAKALTEIRYAIANGYSF